MSETGERRGVNGAPARAASEDPAAAFALPELSWPPDEAGDVLLVPLVGPGDEGPGDGELDCFEVDGLALPSEPALVRDN